eukprot:11056100-Alexandrium_andersonii.AAC.1
MVSSNFLRSSTGVTVTVTTTSPRLPSERAKALDGRGWMSATGTPSDYLLTMPEPQKPTSCLCRLRQLGTGWGK